MNQIHVIILVVFFFSSISKIISLNRFTNVIEELGFPKKTILAFLVLILELCVVVCMLVPYLFMVGVYVVFLLCFLFVVSAVIALYRKKEVLCSCFGEVLPEKLGKSTFLKSALIFSLNCVLLFFKEKNDLWFLPFLDWYLLIAVSLGVLLIYGVVVIRLKYVETKRNFVK